MAKQRYSISPEDIALFRREMADVKPLQQDKAPRFHTKPAAVPRQRALDAERVLVDMMSDYFEPAELETGEELLFKRLGVPQRVFRKLRRGQFAVQAELDLHGYTAALAREAVASFLRTCQSRRFTCVRIVHGKGNQSPGREPVLKGKVNRWLRQRDEVLAFSSAKGSDGGTGAIYVLLKRHTAA